MAYYNPNTTDDSYYDPYQQQGNRGEALRSQLGQMAKTFAVVGVLNIAGAALTHSASLRAGAAIKSYGKGILGRATQSIERPSISSILKNTNTGKEITSWVQKTPIYKAGIAREVQNKAYATAHPERAAINRVTSAFKDPKTFAATYIKLWGKTVGAGIGVAYAVDSTLGLTQSQMGLEKKALWDIPGQVGNFAKWTAGYSVYGPMFGALGPAAGVLNTYARRAVGTAYKSPVMKRFMESRLAKAGPAVDAEDPRNHFIKESIIDNTRNAVDRKLSTNWVNKLISAAETVRDVHKDINASFQAGIHQFGRSTGTFAQKVKSSFSPTWKSIQNSKEIFKRHVSESSQTGMVHKEGLHMLRLLDSMHRNEQPAGLGENASLSPIIGMVRSVSEKMEKPSILNYAFPHLKALRNKDVWDETWLQNVQGTLSNKYAKDEVQQLISHVGNMRVGSHVYQGFGGKIKGGGVDLTAFDPLVSTRRMLAGLMEFEWRVPFANVSLKLGDITQWNKHLAEQPNLYFFEKTPGFRAKDQHGRTSSLMELAGTNRAQALYVRTPTGSKYALLDGQNIKVATSDSALMYANMHSTSKTNELQELNLPSIKLAQAAADANEAQDRTRHGKVFNNPFLNFLQKKVGLSIPAQFKEAVYKIEEATKGKNFSYRMASDKVFNSNDEEFMEAAKVLEGVFDHTSPILGKVARSREGLDTLAHAVGLNNDWVDSIWYRSSLDKRVSGLDLSADSWSNHKGLQEAVEMSRAYPEKARSHAVRKPLGGLSDMTSDDVLRTSILDYDLNKQWMESGNGREHPMIEAATELQRKGLVTPSEAKGLKLRAKLSVFRDMGMFRGMRHDEIVIDAVAQARRGKYWDAKKVHNEVIDFISNNDMRRPSIRKSQDRWLDDYEAALHPSDTEPSRFIKDMYPFASVGQGAVAGGRDYIRGVLNSTTNVIQEFLPFKKDPVKHFGIRGNLKFLAGIMATGGVFGLAYKLADASVATNPVFDDTILDQGITGAAADAIAKAHLATSKIANSTGISQAIRYFDGLMPGSMSTLPGAMIGLFASKTFGGGTLKAMKWMAGGALINRIANPYLPDFGKKYEDLKAEYSGERMVPFKKSPTWLLGGTPWEGTKVEGYEPNWYIRAHSRWKASDALYGSEFRKIIHEPIPLIGINVGDILDPYYMERKHYNTRPYGLTGTFGEDIPLIGPLVGATLGRIIKPQITMHQAFLKGEWAQGGGGTDFAQRPPTLEEGIAGIRQSPGMTGTAGRERLTGTYVYGGHKNWAQVSAQQFLNGVTSFAGLQGFMAKSTMNLVSEPTVIPTLETAGRMSSMVRSFYDMNLGGMGVLSEGTRRLFAKPDYKVYGLNPIPNMLPNYLPEEFLTGDPYCCELSALTEIENIQFMEAQNVTTERMYTHKGRLISPIKSRKRTVKKKEKVYNLKIQSLCGIPTKYSEDHPILSFVENKFVWKKIKGIHKDDLVCYPIPKRNFAKQKILDLSNILPYKFSDEYIYCDNRINSQTINAIEFLEGKTHTYTGPKSILNKYKYKIKKGKIRRINRYLELDEDIMYFFGMWIAEGWINSRSVYLSHNIKEKEKSERCNIGAQKINKCSYKFYPIPETNAARSYLGSFILSDILRSLFGHGASNKKIPDIFWYLEDNLIYSFIKGYFDGDGNYYEKNGRSVISFGSCNKILLLQIRKLLLSLGKHVFNFNKSTDKKITYLGTQAIHTGINYKLISNQYDKELYKILGISATIEKLNQRKAYEISNNYLILKVIDAKEVQLKEVIGFQIQQDESFCVAGIATHNTKIMKGELRLPGRAYQLTHPNLRQTMPGRSSMFGAPLEHQIQYFTGLLPPVLKEEYDILNEGTAIHAQVQDMLAAEGLLIKAEALVYDVKNDISGHVDAIIKDGQGGKGRRGLEIKSISGKGFEKLDAPKSQHMCLHPHTKIIMGNGSIKPITEIIIDDVIRNRYGKAERVIATSKRFIDESILKINIYGHSKNDIQCTKNHEFLAVRTKSCTQANHGCNSSPCFQGRGHCENCKHKFYEDYKPEWILSEQLKMGDFLLRYRLRSGNKSVILIDKYKTKRSRNIPNISQLDYKIGKLFGYYLAEGSLTKRQIIWSFNIKEKEYTDEIKKILLSIGLDSRVDEQFENNVRNIICNSTVLSNIIMDLFSKTKTKKIHEDLFDYNEEFLQGLFDGYMNGDGHITKENKYVFGTASRRLANDLLDLCNILGYNPAITFKKQVICTIKGVITKSENPFYRLEFYKDKTSSRFIRNFGDYVGYRIYKIQEISYNGLVYDLQVENSRSFSTDSIISSNSQLNFYLRMLHLRKGTLLYINRDNPSQVKSYEINYSQSRWEKDLDKLKRARQASADMLERGGSGDSLGYSYSWLDRLNILSDVGPGSKEFKEAKGMVEDQISYGLLTEKEISEYKTTLQHKKARIRKYELYPLRFRGQVVSPSTEKNIQSINENIKAAADYSMPERAVGALWENFVNTNSIITNKFFAFKDPLEHYKTLKLYGKEYKPWDEPIKSWAEPYTRGMLSKTDPIAGAISWGTGGTVLGGHLGGAIGGALGSIYGAAHGLWRTATGSTYIPGLIKEQREINEYFDRLKFIRSDRMSQLAGGELQKVFQADRDATLFAFNQSDGSQVANLFRSTPYNEKPYIESFLNETDPKRQKEILRYIPKDLGTALQKAWAGIEQKEMTGQRNKNISMDMLKSPDIQYDRSLLDPAVALDDIKLKTIEDTGQEVHDFGLGWNEQRYRMQESFNMASAEQYVSSSAGFMDTPNISSTIVRQKIIETASSMGARATSNVYINNGIDDFNFVQITIRRNRARSIIQALDNRQRYMG